MKRDRLRDELRRHQVAGIDTSLLVYHFEDVAPYADLTEVVFEEIGSGSIEAVLSTISITELFVKPFATAQDARQTALEALLLGLPNTRIVPASYTVAKLAARLRARHGVRTPDALLIATALEQKASAFVTNDRRLRRLKVEGIGVVVLQDYV